MKAAILSLLMLATAQAAATSSLLGDNANNPSLDTFLTSYSKSAKPADVKPTPVGIVNEKLEPFVDVNDGVAPKAPAKTVAKDQAALVPQINPCIDPNSTIAACVDLHKKAQDAANRKKAADDLARSQAAADLLAKKAAADLVAKKAAAVQRLQAYKQCSNQESTNSFADLKKMSNDILGFDVTSKSLVEADARKGKGQFWLQNAGGSAQIRMKSDFGGHFGVFELPAPVQACLFDANTVRITGCAHYWGERCFNLKLSRTGSKRIQIADTGGTGINVISNITSASEIAR